MDVTRSLVKVCRNSELTLAARLTGNTIVSILSVESQPMERLTSTAPATLKPIGTNSRVFARASERETRAGHVMMASRNISVASSNESARKLNGIRLA